MTPDEPAPDSLGGAIAEYLRLVDAGTAPDREAFLAAHVKHTAGLRSFFGNQDHFEPLAVPFRPIDSDATLPPDASSVNSLRPVIRYFGDYELLHEIARGGMGVVYRARQVSLNRIVALKMILAGQLASSADVQRFRAEAEAAANLDHPNIVPIYEVGEHEGQQYFSMKLIEGGSLAEKIKSSITGDTKRKGLVPVVYLLFSVARAVHYAHQRGILHRDLKPANVLLDAVDTPYVTDFGLAKRVAGDSGLTQSGAIVGTPNYMAPEQARAEKQLSTAVDVYSLGAILYECLSGGPPFRADTPLDTLLQVLEKEPERPTNCDRDLATIALKCLEKEPAKRYESAAAFAEDLRRWEEGETILARPPKLSELVGRWLRRNALAFTWTVLLGVLWGMSVGVSAVATLENESTLPMWPSSLTNPIGWAKLAGEIPWIAHAALGAAGVFTFGVSWLLLVLTRPKDRRSAIAFATAMGLVATLTAFLFVGPFQAIRDQHPIHPIEDDYHATVLIMQSSGYGVIPPTDIGYLKQFLPPEKQNFKYRGWGSDILALRAQARYANQLGAAFDGIWVSMLASTGMLLSLAFVSIILVWYCQINRKSVVNKLALYAEMYLPAACLIVGAWITAFLALTGSIPNSTTTDIAAVVMPIAILGCLLVGFGICAVVLRRHLAIRFGGYVMWGIGTFTVLYESGWLNLINPDTSAIERASTPKNNPPSPPPAIVARSGDPRALQILERLGKDYLELKTYRDTARGQITFTPDDGTKKTHDLTSSIAFVRPDRLRLEFRTQSAAGLTERHAVLWKAGKDVNVWSSWKSAEPSSLETELAGIAGGSTFIAHNVPHLLLGTKGIPPYLAELDGAKLLETQRLESTLCHRVEGKSGAWNVVLWVDEQSGLMRRLELRNRFAASVTDFQPIANEAITDELLEFRPPAGKNN
jgi:serine/threonine protein kinase